MSQLKLGEFGYIGPDHVAARGSEAFINPDVEVTRRSSQKTIRVKRVRAGCHITFIGFKEYRWLTKEPAEGAVNVLKVFVGGASYNSWHTRIRYTPVAETPIGSVRYVLFAHIYNGPHGRTVRAGTITFTQLEAGMVGIRRPSPTEYQMRLTRTGRWQPLFVED